MRRFIFLIHRYLGIGIGIMVSLWCLSGFVMMYVPYPDFSEEERLTHSPPLQLEGCCFLPSLEEFSDIPLNSARISSWANRPVLLLEEDFGGLYPIDLGTGEYIGEITQNLAGQHAQEFAGEIGPDVNAQFRGSVDSDQWTLTGEYDYDRPLLQYEMSDGKGTRIYLSSFTGQILQQTTALERGWGIVGSVVHWLYPSFIRQHQTLWYWTIVILSLVGGFLTLAGIYIAVVYFCWKGDGPKSPFSGWGYWHHILGLCFGLLTLTWLLSGMFSMNPWGLFEARSIASERQAVSQTYLSFDTEFRESIRNLDDADLDASFVSIEIKMIGGQLVALAKDRSGQTARYRTDNWQPESLEQAYFESIALNIKPDVPIKSQQWIEQQDNYYYSMDSTLSLPAYRVIYQDGERAYFDHVSGDLVSFFDSGRSGYRWFFKGLHSLDLVGWMRVRPLWDLLVLLLMTGVTAGAITGTWLGWRVLTRNR